MAVDVTAPWPRRSTEVHAEETRAGCCRVIHTFMPKVLENFRFSSASNVGRGGMEAKVASAWDAAQSGVTTVIANGKMPSVLLRARP